jgi:hypothetical protein
LNLDGGYRLSWLRRTLRSHTSPRWLRNPPQGAPA